MNPYDLTAIVVLALAIVLGFRSGAVPQVGGLAGAVAGGVGGVLVIPAALGLAPELDPSTRAVLVLVVLLATVGIGETLGSAIGRRVTARLGDGFAAAIDQVGGGFVGFAQGLLIVWLMGGILAAGAIPNLTTVAQTSVALRTINRALPPPTELATGLGRLLDASGLPDVFVGFEPLPAPPVGLPDDPDAAAIARAAINSTVKVSAATCGSQSSGSGFAIAPDYVVTNAHVIAGSSSVRVTLGNRLSDANPVFFDGDLDIAVLHVPRLGATPLRFATTDPARGTLAAAIGFPGGRGLTVMPAAVAGSYRGRRPGPDRHTARRPLDPGTTGRDRTWRFGRTARASRRDGGRCRVRRVAGGSRRRLCAGPVGRCAARGPRRGPDERGVHGWLPELTPCPIRWRA